MVLSDRLWGLLWSLFGLAVFWRAQSFPVLPGQAYGSALMPGIVGAGLFLCGLALIAADLRRRPRPPLVRLSAEARSRARLIDAGAILAALVAFILLAGRLGFLITATAVIGGLVWRFRGRAPFLAFGLALAAVLVVDWLFRVLLLVPLPLGPLPYLPW